MVSPDPRYFLPAWLPPPDPDDTAAGLRLLAAGLRNIARALDELAEEGQTRWVKADALNLLLATY